MVLGHSERVKCKSQPSTPLNLLGHYSIRLNFTQRSHDIVPLSFSSTLLDKEVKYNSYFGLCCLWHSWGHQSFCSAGGPCGSGDPQMYRVLTFLWVCFELDTIRLTRQYSGSLLWGIKLQWSPNLHDTKICFRFFQRGYHYFGRSQDSGLLLWDMEVTSPLIMGDPDYWVVRDPLLLSSEF